MIFNLAIQSDRKVVLSACSTYFDTILSQYEEKDPIVIMRDVKFSDIKVLVEFMYKGEINIDHDFYQKNIYCNNNNNNDDDDDYGDDNDDDRLTKLELIN
ncbi:hypothetical protein HZH68_016659 [Vespula germanica]|uniref:BTB domain-containing protein n=1 Tax=Vespula germanica TaxID=30212 RepID=A0A834J657_VESGE|nr:hypothetical protein HZH68_016659 [Vespula germanica]